MRTRFVLNKICTVSFLLTATVCLSAADTGAVRYEVKADRRTGKNRAGTYAKRFAAKEACSKALGTGMAKGVFWTDLAVTNLPGGQPTITLTGGAAKRLAALTPPGMQAQLHLTMTDEYPYASAQVIITAVPTTGK